MPEDEGDGFGQTLASPDTGHRGRAHRPCVDAERGLDVACYRGAALCGVRYAITGSQAVADADHGALRLLLLTHFPLDLVVYLRYTQNRYPIRRRPHIKQLYSLFLGRVDEFTIQG